jgi:nucleotide-binding universal stress UspA family protein
MTDKRPILLATDGSPSAAGAQREAFELARLTDAPLLVVAVEHVVLPAVGYAAYGYSNIVVELTAAEQKRVAATLEKVEEAATADGIHCRTVEAEGAIAEEICRIASERGARMIVVGSHGWGAGKRLLFGSVSAALLHQAPCPVLVVPAPDAGAGKHVQAAA